MTRGNQREKARAKNELAKKAQKNKNSMSGSEQAAAKLKNDAIMMEKQRRAEEKKAQEDLAKVAEAKVKAAQKKTNTNNTPATPPVLSPVSPKVENTASKNKQREGESKTPVEPTESADATQESVPEEKATETA